MKFQFLLNLPYLSIKSLVFLIKQFFIKGKSVSSKDAILYIGQFNFSKKSTAVSSKVC